MRCRSVSKSCTRCSTFTIAASGMAACASSSNCSDASTTVWYSAEVDRAGVFTTSPIHPLNTVMMTRALAPAPSHRFTASPPFPPRLVDGDLVVVHSGHPAVLVDGFTKIAGRLPRIAGSCDIFESGRKFHEAVRSSRRDGVTQIVADGYAAGEANSVIGPGERVIVGGLVRRPSVSHSDPAQNDAVVENGPPALSVASSRGPEAVLDRRHRDACRILKSQRRVEFAIRVADLRRPRVIVHPAEQVESGKGRVFVYEHHRGAGWLRTIRDRMPQLLSLTAIEAVHIRRGSRYEVHDIPGIRRYLADHFDDAVVGGVKTNQRDVALLDALQVAPLLVGQISIREQRAGTDSIGFHPTVERNSVGVPDQPMVVGNQFILLRLAEPIPPHAHLHWAQVIEGPRVILHSFVETLCLCAAYSFAVAVAAG